MLKKNVLVKSISNLSDARYCAGMGVEFLAFELDQNHVDFIGLDKIKEIKGWLIGPKIGGRVSEDFIDLAMLKELNFDFIITDNESSITHYKEGVGIVLLETSDIANDLADAIIVNTATLNDTQVIQANVPVFVESSAAMELAREIDQLDNIEGLVLKGSHEVRPGFSSYDQLMDILETLED